MCKAGCHGSAVSQDSSGAVKMAGRNGRGRVEGLCHSLVWSVCEPVFSWESGPLGSNTHSTGCVT